MENRRPVRFKWLAVVKGWVKPEKPYWVICWVVLPSDFCTDLKFWTWRIWALVVTVASQRAH